MALNKDEELVVLEAMGYFEGSDIYSMFPRERQATFNSAFLKLKKSVESGKGFKLMIEWGYGGHGLCYAGSFKTAKAAWKKGDATRCDFAVYNPKGERVSF